MSAVCILAAGQGTRVSAFGGLLHKSLLPLGPTAILTHIFHQLPADARFVVAVGHLSDQIKAYVELAHPELDVRFVEVGLSTGSGAGPGRSLWECRDLLDEPFLLTAADTLVGAVPDRGDESWMGVASIDDPTKWCTVSTDSDNAVTALHYRDPEGGSIGYTGIAWIADPACFFDGLTAELETVGEVQVNAGFEALIEAGQRIQAIPVDWTDTGTDENYAAACAAQPGALDWGGKVTDATYVVGNRVVKWFADPVSAHDRVDRHLTGQMPFPRFLGSAHGWLAYEYVAGAPLVESIDIESTCQALDWAEARVWRALPADTAFKMDCRAFYVSKTSRRVADVVAQLGWVAEPEMLTINGIRTRSVMTNLLQVEEAVVAQAIPSTFHGDFHDSNIIVSENGLVAIDWRDRFGSSQVRGDRVYDLAKFLHTLELSHEVMATQAFEISHHDDGVTIIHEDSDAVALCRLEFWRWVTDHGYPHRAIGIIDAAVFCNMAPLYPRPLSEYLYLFGRLLLDSRVRGEDALLSVLVKRRVS